MIAVSSRSFSSSLKSKFGMRSFSSGCSTRPWSKMRGSCSLVLEPRELRRVRDVVDEREVEPRDQLAALLRQLGADRLRVLEALDVVAAEAAVAVDDALAELDLLRARRPASPSCRLGLLERHHRLEVVEQDRVDRRLVGRAPSPRRRRRPSGPTDRSRRRRPARRSGAGPACRWPGCSASDRGPSCRSTRRSSCCRCSRAAGRRCGAGRPRARPLADDVAAEAADRS